MEEQTNGVQSCEAGRNPVLHVPPPEACPGTEQKYRCEMIFVVEK